MGKMSKSIVKAMDVYLEKYFPDEKKQIAKKAKELYPGLEAKAQFIGGRENFMSGNLYMMITFLAYYEASGKRIAENAIEEIAEIVFGKNQLMSKLVDMNKASTAKIFYRLAIPFAKKANRKKAEGKWGNTWGFEINPDQRKEGFCMHLVGCPLADYARENGYLEILPYMCKTDHITAKVMHAKLIRTHTVARGSETCDYWYVGDQSEIAKQYQDFPEI